MADFCQMCSIEMFGKDYKELALDADSPLRGTLKPGEGWLEMCEGCGPVLVNDDGRRIDTYYSEDWTGRPSYAPQSLGCALRMWWAGVAEWLR